MGILGVVGNCERYVGIVICMWEFRGVRGNYRR